MADIVRARKACRCSWPATAARLSAFVDALRFFAPEIEILRFPAWDCLPYDRIGPSAGRRGPADGDAVAAGARGWTTSRALLVTTVPALVQRVPPQRAVQAGQLLGPVGQRRRDRRPGALFRRQRLSARLDRLRARRVRHPRRGDRRLPARRRGAGAARPVRRHPGIHPRLRSGDPALDQAAEGRRPAAGQRGPAGRGRHRPLPHRLSGDLRRAGRRPALRHGQRGRPARRHGALAAAVLPTAGDPVRLPAGATP